MALERELETYRQKLPELLCDEGKFALVREDALIGIYGTYGDALEVGYQRFGLAPFLVKQIQLVEPVQFISRLFIPGCRVA